MSIFLLYALVGLGLFYVQNLFLFPHVPLGLLGVLIFYVGLRSPLPLAFGVAVVLGLVQDTYAVTPLGLHLAGGMIIVAAARFCRQRFLLQRAILLVAAIFVVLFLQGMVLRLILFISGYHSFLVGDLVSQRGLEIVGTALLAPLMFALLQGLEKISRRLGGSSGSDRRLDSLSP